MAEKKEVPVYTAEDVAKHDKESDCWLIIGNESNGGPKVYDVTKYLDDHPGGAEVMMEFAGKDADSMFEDIGHSKEARTTMSQYFIGNLKDDGKSSKTTPTATKKVTEIKSKGGGLSPVAIIAVLIAIVLGVYFSQQQK
eukprot:CAMPEP_0185024158 /NCGR_PEP_ID=MMETSP1103-20130426/7127_1 /TAXON_ID=36769 /ORGANISM="Paraphysomonas bandaiensis, Strain Caron Lab Isolate" /LENGTH=138 /DNA_ID=CAMNT_0027557047 /DNA_START=59 /DNA_END=475 /DNA_ORIENTATION=-